MFTHAVSLLPVVEKDLLLDLAIVGAGLAALPSIKRYIFTPIMKRFISPIFSKNVVRPLADSLVDPDSIAGDIFTSTMTEIVEERFHTLSLQNQQILDELGKVVHEVTFNNGGSIKDAVKRIESVQADTLTTITNDKTEWKAMLEANRRATESHSTETRLRFRELAVGSSVALIETDGNGVPILVNQAWCDMTGLTLSDAVDNSPSGWRRAMEANEGDRILEIWQDVHEHKRETFGPIDCSYRLPSGVVNHVTMASKAIHDREGVVIGWIGSLTPR